MGFDGIKETLFNHLEGLKKKGTLKGGETVITGVKPAQGRSGPRYHIHGYGNKEFIRMNANNYLGMSLIGEVIEAEERAARKYGVGPGAVRFISGTYQPHMELEKKLAEFHGKGSAMLFSSAYAATMGTLPPLISGQTIVISDEFNHNCIINAIRLARPKDKMIYGHNDVEGLEKCIQKAEGKCSRLLVVTDGIFSMRGDHAPLHEIAGTCKKFEQRFEEGIITIVDDSHGVGAFGETGRGTAEYTNEKRIDIIISTLGKALGVNGGYVVSDVAVTDYLRETSPFYIYSNPITVSEASAALKALEILEGPEGKNLLQHLRAMTARFEKGLLNLGYEVIRGEHPVVPLMVRDTKKTEDLVLYLKENGVLATGLNYPVVPKGDEEIRFQICADHTEHDVDYVLSVLGNYEE